MRDAGGWVVNKPDDTKVAPPARSTPIEGARVKKTFKLDPELLAQLQTYAEKNNLTEGAALEALLWRGVDWS